MDNQDKKLSLSALIEAILFYTAEPMSIKKLSSLTKKNVEDIKSAVLELQDRLNLSNGGIKLLIQNNEVVLGTSPEASELIENITKDEISKELSKAALETLSIICYKGPLTRSEIDYIRGVNSTFIIRNLLIRGIVEKLENPRDLRANLYGPTFAALEYMGVTKKEELPKYEDIQAQLEAFLAEKSVDDNLEQIKQNESPIESNIDSGLELEADIVEENIMGDEYNDEEIEEHTKYDSLTENENDLR